MPSSNYALEPLESRRLLTSLPPGFVEELLVSGLPTLTSMAFLPDGRLLVAEQDGTLQVFDASGQMFSTPMAQLNVDQAGERGLIGVAVSPTFEQDNWIYLFYTSAFGESPRPPHGRVSRFQVQGNQVVAGSEQILMEFDDAAATAVHNGGAMKFGVDGMLYIGIGDNANPLHAQQPDKFAGKVLRIAPDGTIPADNPFYDVLTGEYRSIYALGLRNPYSIDINPNTGQFFANDVGAATWEEINQIVPAANYGWPLFEGDFDDQINPGYTRPLYTYPHNPDCAITGGAFYVAHKPVFGEEYEGDYFFMDFCGNWIRRLDFDQSGGFSVETFATNLPGFSVGLSVAPNGWMYFLSLSDGSVRRIRPTDDPSPFIVSQPQSITASVGQPVEFSVEASGEAPLAYQWYRAGEPIEAATGPKYTIPSVVIEDNGVEFVCVVSNVHAQVSTVPAVLTVITRQPPALNIESPAVNSTYAAGELLAYAGFALDEEGLAIPADRLTWKIDFHHDEHVHPFMAEQTGVLSGAIGIPNFGHTESNVWYRVYFSATDSLGLRSTNFVDVHPRTADITLATWPIPGITLTLDGSPKLAPYAFEGVAGIVQRVEAPQSFSDSGQIYLFDRWSDGGARVHDFTTPEQDYELTAYYLDLTPPSIETSSFEFDGAVTGEAHMIWLRFSEDVGPSFGAGDWRLERVDGGDEIPPEAASVEYNPDTFEARIMFPGLAGKQLPDGQYRFSVGAGAIEDVAGNGKEDDFELDFFVLAGDINRDRAVNVDDFGILAANFNRAPAAYAHGDLDYSGGVDIDDFAVLADRFNQSLPTVMGAARVRTGGHPDTVFSSRPVALPAGADTTSADRDDFEPVRVGLL